MGKTNTHLAHQLQLKLTAIDQTDHSGRKLSATPNTSSINIYTENSILIKISNLYPTILLSAVVVYKS